VGTRRPPWVTYLLIVTNLVVFATPAPTIVLAVFRNDGWVQLAGNLLFLLVLGSNVEDRFGRIRFGVFYLLCGYLAVFCSAAIHGTGARALISGAGAEALAGASGAAAGVAGAYLAVFPRARAGSMARVLRYIPHRLPAWPVLIAFFVFQWFAGDILQAAIGFVAGVFAAVPMLRRRPRYAHPARRRWRRAAAQ
jgi:membrane associated rhomboid family serine protease